MRFNRRDFVSSMAAAGLVGLAGRPACLFAAGASSPSKIIFLVTGGGTVLGGERAMPASMMLVGDQMYLVDCGYGTSLEIAKAKLTFANLGNIFITHNHADHMLDLGPLLFFTWLQGRTKPIDVYGPTPIKSIVNDLLAANEVPMNYYRTDMAMHDMPAVNTHEASGAGAVMQDANVRVTSTLVEHPPVVPAFAYRFELPDRSVVFSGDTAPTQSLVALAKGADILVHEASEVDKTIAQMSGAQSNQAGGAANGPGGARPRGFDPAKFAEHVHKAHTSAEDAGRIAAEAGVKVLVLNHLSPVSSTLVPDSLWLEEAGRHFKGKIIVSHDGLVI